jgi:L-threonylcarbamoyladenylate synthase
MQLLTVDPDEPPEPAVVRASAAILRGAIVAYPTDTLYGLGVDPRSAAAVRGLFAAKRRAADAALPLIAADLEQVTRLGDMTALARRLAGAFWPGPLSLILTAHTDVTADARGEGDTIAIRVPASAVARALARAAGVAITATSANRSGLPPAATAAEVIAALGDDVALVLDGGATARRTPSTIVDARFGRPTLVRAGAVPWERVLESLE